MNGIFKVDGPTRRWDVASRVAPRGFARRRSVWLTNSPALAERLVEMSRSSAGGQPWRQQVPMMMMTILGSLKEQMIQNGDLNTLEAYAAGPVAEEPVLTEDVAEEFRDTVNGGYLDPEKARAARAEELRWVESADLFEAVPREMATSKPVTM